MDGNEKSISSAFIPTIQQHGSHNTPTIYPRLTCSLALSHVHRFALVSDLFGIAICCSLVSRGASGICHTLHFTILTNHKGVTPTINTYFSLTLHTNQTHNTRTNPPYDPPNVVPYTSSYHMCNHYPQSSSHPDSFQLLSRLRGNCCYPQRFLSPFLQSLCLCYLAQMLHPFLVPVALPPCLPQNHKLLVCLVQHCFL